MRIAQDDLIDNAKFPDQRGVGELFGQLAKRMVDRAIDHRAGVIRDRAQARELVAVEGVDGGVVARNAVGQ